MPNDTFTRLMRPINCAFVWLTIGVAVALLIPTLAMNGMFMDGMLYSVVAHNQANGFGTFWFPRFSATGLAGLETFHEHPPLGFGIQALWFQLFGSAFWVERAFSLITALITGVLIVAIWRAWTGDRPALKQLAWSPLLLWIIIPTVHWCYHNNMLENTMGIFTTAAVFFVVRGQSGRSGLMHILAGVMVFLATMTKGLPGLFPLAAPVFIALVLRRSMLSSIGASLLMLFVIVLCYGMIALNAEAREALMIHVDQRLMHRVAEVPTVDHRWATLEMLFTNMLGPLGITTLVAFAGRRSSPEVEDPMFRPALAMAFIGFSGVFPLMLTMVQKSFYMAAALPMLAIALALFLAPTLARILEKAKTKNWAIWIPRWMGIAGTVIAIVIAIMFFGKPLRDANTLHDVAIIGEQVRPGSILMVPEEMWNDWHLQAYLMRYHFISLDTRETGNEMALTRKSLSDLEGFQPVPLDTREYQLWERER